MKTNILFSFFAAFFVVILIVLSCDAPDSDSGQCQRRIRLYALPSEILANGVDSSIIQGFIKDAFGNNLQSAIVQLLTTGGSFGECSASAPATPTSTTTRTPTPTPTLSLFFSQPALSLDKSELLHDPKTFPGYGAIDTDEKICTTGGSGDFAVTLISSTLADTVAEITVYVPVIDCRNKISVNFMRNIPYQISLVANPASVPAYRGKSYITATVTDAFGNVVTPIDVDFNTNLGTFDDTSSRRTIIATDSFGQATAILESNGTPGVATVNAVVGPNLASINVIFTP